MAEQAPRPESIGLIVVHGIGEQGRFEHLDGHIRGVVNGLRRDGHEVTVEIGGSSAAAFQAQQESWRAGPHAALRLVVRTGAEVKHIHVHEVWWADVNERYSVMKQARFWAWGLSVWNYPARPSSPLPTAASMFPPRSGQPIRKEWLVRARLFCVSCLFLLASMTIGVGLVLAKRLFGFEAPDLLKIFANYLSSIKLYNQRHRSGPGFPAANADFLDAMDDPPRTSVRRRMIRTIADVACRNYDRWYILAHSQGSVVAFNGLMEPAFGWPGYLDEPRWRRLCARGLAGPGKGQAPAGKMVPARPAWVAPDGIAYRSRIFGRFGGILTYGCPLEKFAAIWPALVAVCREPAFAHGTQWLNVYDPIDPVSGLMRSWPTADPRYCPAPTNIGYAASPVLLLSHNKYLECPSGFEAPERKPDPHDLRLADGIARWLLTGDSSGITSSPGSRFFAPGGQEEKRRHGCAYLQWAAVFIIVSLLAAAVAPKLLDLILWTARSAWDQVSPFFNDLRNHRRDLFGHAVDFLSLTGELVLGAGAVTLLFGLALRWKYGGNRLAQPKPIAFTGTGSPEPDAVIGPS